MNILTEKMEIMKDDIESYLDISNDHKGDIGLVNLGNTCYVNSII